ncbi:MAG TPA: branched-chain amino acid transaminase [Pyrinomonadaceae bacterium]|nr:branched-chain amino acid transaminase [Pyrinomonadaceae bacterium]
MTFERTQWVWMNGELLPWSKATTHVSSHALHYGTGVFEGIRCYETKNGPALFRLEEHLERFFASAAIHGIEIPFSMDDLTEAMVRVIRENDFNACYVRPIAYFGSGSLSLYPRNCAVEVVILAWHWADYLGAEGQNTGVSVTVSPWRKFESKMMPTTAKACGQYVNSVLAIRDAISRGFAEAILLDVDGRIAEGSGENLFIVRGGELFTNDASHSILPGITRDAVLRIANELGYSVGVKALSLQDLFEADEAFFTGTAVEVTPIRELDGNSIGRLTPGPVTSEIQRVFFAATAGQDAKYNHWLYPISSPSKNSPQLLQTVS